jgi:Protein of unknown function (DUF2442)
MIKLTHFDSLGGYHVRATFSDGMVGDYDFAEAIARGGPTVEPLREPEYFRRVILEHGAPIWPNGHGACPDCLRRRSLHLDHGQCSDELLEGAASQGEFPE